MYSLLVAVGDTLLRLRSAATPVGHIVPAALAGTVAAPFQTHFRGMLVFCMPPGGSYAHSIPCSSA